MLIEASELSSRGSGMNMLCSSHSFQTVFLEVLGTGAISIVKVLIEPLASALRIFLNSSKMED